jgi:ADP-heptose:LPS heptosyltransferase
MKKKLLFVVSNCLGESLFATAAIDILSKEYDIYILCVGNLKPIFLKYSFVKKVITYNIIWPRTMQCIGQDKNAMRQIVDCFGNIVTEKIYVAWQDDDWDRIYFCDNEYFKNFIILPLKPKNEFLKVSRNRLIGLRLGIATIDNLESFDWKIRKPTYTKHISNGDIIVNQGSDTRHRQFTPSVIEKFINKIPEATYFVKENTLEEIYNKYKKLKFVLTHPKSFQSLLEIIKLFESGPRCMITTDSGLAHLAIAYEIPIIWVETWVDPIKVLDPHSMHLITIFRKKNLTCLKNCNAKYSTGPWRSPESLECNTTGLSCLDLSDEDINEILSKIPNSY